MVILDTFVQHGIVKKEDAPGVLRRVEEGATLEDALIQFGISKEDVLRGRGIYYNLPIRDLKGKGVPFDILKYIPEDSASHYHFAPIGIVNGILEIGILDPENIEARDALQFIATKVSMPFKIYLISRDDFRSILENYRGLSGEVTKALSELEVDISDVKKGEIVTQREPSVKETEDEKKRAHVAEDAPVAKITAVILRHATEGGASDVHIEHMGEQVRVRFRVDGELYTSLILPVNVHSSVVARIKILANLKLDEKRKPQDGRFSARIDGRKIDFRVSTFPAYYGEKVVMRILDTQKGIRTLAETGFRPRDLALVRSALARPYGIILITGPTGSGKSTTLYSMLNELDKETRNIISLEDPVEYNIAGINQSQVRPEIGYTFANGLRTTLRQDPDIIMVGEIRDRETAALAIQAALTGHIVLSTLHTNDAMGVVPRLIDMGVEKYLIPPTLNVAAAQRLLRRLCADCKLKVKANVAEEGLISEAIMAMPEQYQKQLLLRDGYTIYKPNIENPCKKCAGKAYKGRIGVYEMLEMTDEFETIILGSLSEAAMREEAKRQGMITMFQDGILKVLKGVASLEELLEVAQGENGG